MTEAERKAMEWLDFECERDYFGRESAIKLREMLARPVLPEEPSRVLLAKIRDARFLNTYGDNADIYTIERHILNEIHAHLTRPATREVEVWRVEWAEWNPILNGGEYLANVKQFYGEESAREYAYELGKRAYKPGHCVQVTGPHKQMVPA
jgi:hypothetical protein